MVYKNLYCLDIDVIIVVFEMKDWKVYMFFGLMNDMVVNLVV